MINSMSLSDRGLRFIAAEESYVDRNKDGRPEQYLDAAGLPTVGIGHLVKPGEAFGSDLSMDAALELLRRDAAEAVAEVNRLVKVQLLQSQFDALVSFVFNVGSPGFSTSSVIAAVQARQFLAVPEYLARWRKAGGGDVLGLARRRAREALLFMEDMR